MRNEKDKLLKKSEGKQFTPRPYRFKFSVKSSSKLNVAQTDFNFWFVNLGLLSCYLICGLVIAALGASIEDIASRLGYRATEIASIYVSRGIGSILGSFASAPIFTLNNAVRALIATYLLTIIVMLLIPLVPLSGLHLLYFLIGALTSVISSGSILLIRKIHKGHAGPWLGALGAALVSAGIIVPWVQMMFDNLWYQFVSYAVVIFIGLLWLRLLPYIQEDINNHDCEVCCHAPTNSFVNNYLVGTRSEICYCVADEENSPEDTSKFDTFFMTPVASVSKISSSSLYEAIVHPDQPFEKYCGSISKHHCPLHHHEVSQTDRNVEGWHQTNSEISELHDQDEEEKGISLTELQQDIMGGHAPPPHYWSDIIIAVMVMFIIGSGSAVSIFLETYVDVTSVIDSQLKAVVLMMFFVSGTVANVIGIFAQVNISDRSLSRLTHVVLLAGAVGMFVIICFPKNADALWFGILAFGFANAITVGFCFNIANRLSYPSAKSTSIIMMGSSIGVSLIPYLTSHLVLYFDMPLMMIWVGFVGLVVPMILLVIAPKFSYLEGIHNF